MIQMHAQVRNHCFHRLFSSAGLISFPKPQWMGCSTRAKKEPVYFNFAHWRKTIPSEGHASEPTSWLWWSANIQCFSPGCLLASLGPHVPDSPGLEPEVWVNICAFLSWLKGCSSRRQRKPGCLSSMLFLSRIQVPSHSTWLFSVEEPLAFRTWRPRGESTVSLHYSAHLLSWISDLSFQQTLGGCLTFSLARQRKWASMWKPSNGHSLKAARNSRESHRLL